MYFLLISDQNKDFLNNDNNKKKSKDIHHETLKRSINKSCIYVTLEGTVRKLTKSSDNTNWPISLTETNPLQS
jgi:hypothetical protein